MMPIVRAGFCACCRRPTIPTRWNGGSAVAAVRILAARKREDGIDRAGSTRSFQRRLRMTHGTNPDSFMPNGKEIGPRMTGILACGLRERVQEVPSRIYCGTLVMTDDTFHLKRANGG